MPRVVGTSVFVLKTNVSRGPSAKNAGALIPPALWAWWFRVCLSSLFYLLTTPLSPSGKGLPLPLPPPQGPGGRVSRVVGTSFFLLKTSVSRGPSAKNGGTEISAFLFLLSCGHLGPSWGHPGPFWGHLGAILGPSWAFLGPLGAILGHLGAVLGPSWSQLLAAGCWLLASGCWLLAAACLGWAGGDARSVKNIL